VSGVPGAGIALTHKVLHHKRPSVFPLLDNKTSAALGGGGDAWLQIHRDLAATPDGWTELECQPLVAHHVAGSEFVSVGSWPVGPAGSAGLDLGGGVELDVDAARPSCLVGLTIELPSGDAPDALTGDLRGRLDMLLGPGSGDDVVALLRAAARDPLRLATARLTGGGRSAGSGSVDLADPPGGDAGLLVAPALQRAAVAYGFACAPGAPPMVRAVGLLEAAVELAAIGGVLDVDGMVERDLHIGVDLLLDAIAGGLGPVPGGKAARAVAGLLRRVSRLAPGRSLVSARLTSLAREFERDAARAGLRLHDHRLPDASGARPQPDVGRPALPAADRPRPPGRVPVDVGSLPGPLAEAPVAASRTGPAEVEVRIDGWAWRRGGLWARAFHAGDGSLLAVAPFRADMGDATARLLVPPDAIRCLEVDLTDRPEMPRPSPALVSMQRAIHLGRLAAQAERLRDLASANLRWRQCARQWARAGDDERAEAARAFGDSGAKSLALKDRRRPNEPGAPLVVDLIDAGR
jgi:hypothetical protein